MAWDSKHILSDQMDLLFHALVGATIGELSPKQIERRQLKGTLGGISPDIANLITYPYLGITVGNPIPYATPSDFYANPWIVDHWSYVPWEITHSLLFWGLVIMPLLYYFKISKLIGIGYLSHIILDLPSHTGIWSSVPLYPFEFMFEGWFDAWAWPISDILFWSFFPFILWRITAYLRGIDIFFLRWPSEIKVAGLEA